VQARGGLPRWMEEAMKRSLVVVLVLGLSTFASAEDKKGKATGKPAGDKAQMGPPKAAPEFLAATKYFLGSWKCDGKMAAGPWGPEAKETTNLGFKMTMNDFYMSIDGDQKTMGATPMSMSFHAMNGYDPMAKKFMRTDYDSTGGYVAFSSPGWEGDKIVFTGDGMMMGQKLKVRHTMAKHNDGEFTSTFEVIGPDGKATPMGDDVCKRTGGAAKK
jgi:hypothetical protein